MDRGLCNQIFNLIDNNAVEIKMAILPEKINGFCIRQSNLYTIVINRLTSNKLLTLLHEFIHIIKRDFNCLMSVNEIEKSTHKTIKAIEGHISLKIKLKLNDLISKAEIL